MRVRSAYASIHMARVRFIEERPASGDEPSEGLLEYAGPRRLRARISIPQVGVVTITTTGGRMIRDGPAPGRPDVRPFSVWELARALPGGVATAALFDADRQLSTTTGGFLHGATLRVVRGVQWEGAGNQGRWTVLEELTPTAVIRYFIHPESYLIWRVERIDRGTGGLVYVSTVESLEVAE